MQQIINIPKGFELIQTSETTFEIKEKKHKLPKTWEEFCDTYTITLNDSDSALRFGEEMPDSRLTEPSDGKVYRLREAILLSKRLGRPLTTDEMEQFEV